MGFSVRVTDGQYTDTASVTVTIKDANDNPPNISPQDLTVTIQESGDVGQVVATFNATDPDLIGGGLYE